MNGRIPAQRIITASFLLVAAMSIGCKHYNRGKELYQPPPPAAPLGTVSDPIWQSMEARAEASDFVVYQHEFGFQNAELNDCGMNHITQMAARLKYCPHLPVLIEPSRMTVDEETDFKYPVHPNPQLDLRRREVVVIALQEMGVPHAEQRVLVAPALAYPANAVEATSAYGQGLSGAGQLGGLGGGLGGFGGAFGGGFGFGGVGGF